MTKAFARIAAGLADATAYAEGDTAEGRVAADPDVKAIRAAPGSARRSSPPG